MLLKTMIQRSVWFQVFSILDFNKNRHYYLKKILSHKLSVLLSKNVNMYFWLHEQHLITSK